MDGEEEGRRWERGVIRGSRRKGVGIERGTRGRWMIEIQVTLELELFYTIA